VVVLPLHATWAALGQSPAPPADRLPGA